MESIDDQEDFERMKNAMGILAFKAEEQGLSFFFVCYTKKKKKKKKN